MALGKRLHEKEWPSVKHASAALGRHESALYSDLKIYREAQGIVTPQMEIMRGGRPPQSAEQKKQADRERQARKRAERRAAKEAAKNGSPGALALLNGHNGANGHANGSARPSAKSQQLELLDDPRVPQLQARVATLESKLAEAEAEVAFLTKEAHTLQKLLMTVGTTL